MEQKFKILLEAADATASQSQSSKPCIQRVPFILRDNQNFKKYYEPVVVSIGPLHHGNAKLKLGEKLKHKLAGLFIKEYELQKEAIYETIKNDLKNFKECYEEEEIKNYDDEDLAWMFFVEGCAVLHFIDCGAQGDGKKLKKLKMKNDQIAFAQQDLFLLENQLPYQVLELLISSICSKVHGENLRKSIKKFIDMIIKDIRGFTPTMQAEQLQHEPTHLLEILRERLVGNNGNKSIVGNNGCESTAEEIFYDDRSNSFRNVQELKVAGIQLKRRKTNQLTDIFLCLKLFTGTLELSPLIVDDSTAPKFLNMIAYEMCPDFSNDFEVTSYISFLSSLIHHPEDVKELLDEGILLNFLGSDEEVCRLLHDIAINLVPNPETYSNVKMHIQQSCFNLGVRRATRKALDDVKKDYFRNLWTTIAVMAAAFAILVSVVQTYFTIFPLPDKCNDTICNFIKRNITHHDSTY